MFATPAFAQTAGQAAADSGFGQIIGLAPLFLVFIAFYFLMIRPQQQRMKKLQEAVNAVKKGDEVTTAGGIVGKVTKVEERLVEVEIATGVKVRVVKATLASIAATGAAKPAND
ncbi:MAG: preprotein translocase subunit YajC [Sphingomonas sp. 28-66-16]|nr:MAG: preprotein translocase subunit YajC [Sphingomonas sp. 28-66-16]